MNISHKPLVYDSPWCFSPTFHTLQNRGNVNNVPNIYQTFPSNFLMGWVASPFLQDVQFKAYTSPEFLVTRIGWADPESCTNTFTSLQQKVKIITRGYFQSSPLVPSRIGNPPSGSKWIGTGLATLLSISFIYDWFSYWFHPGYLSSVFPFIASLLEKKIHPPSQIFNLLLKYIYDSLLQLKVEAVKRYLFHDSMCCYY